jgi:Ca-activated chloride channel family protein
MKTNLPYLCIFYVFLFCCLTSTRAQDRVLSKATADALNNYLIYSNEVVFGVNIMYNDFCLLNEQFNQFAEGKSDTIRYTKEKVLNNYKYFPVYPRDLFNTIYNENIHIPYDKRGAPLKLIGKVVSVIDEIQRTRNTLDRYIQSEDYRRDSVLQKGYKLLRRVEVLYYDIFTLQEKLYWSLQTIMASYELPAIDNDLLVVIQELQPLLTQSKVLIKSVRAKDVSSSLAFELKKQKELINILQQRKKTLFADIPPDLKNLKSTRNRFDNLLGKANQLYTNANEYLINPSYQELPHPPSHYYYNVRLLSQYNRYGDGLATLFNKIITNSSNYWLYEHEMPFLFAVVYPDIPAYAAMQPDSIPDAEAFIKKIMEERAKKDSIALVTKDSLSADSIAKSIMVIPSDTPSMEGYATNNLVFLLDISSSMNTPEKLPLLKDAMKYLLDLMREEDKITLITYSTKAELLLPPTSALLKDSILNTINQLQTEGVSNANVGINLAYTIAQKAYIPNGNNRIILATDGGFKVEKRIKKKIKKGSKQRDKTYLSVFYFSAKEFNHNKVFLEDIARWGKGKYSYIEPENVEETLLREAQAVRKK